VILIVRQYLEGLRQQGLPISLGVVFGSQASGNPNAWSKIDLLVISPRFDQERKQSDINLLWRAARRTDSRIEPIPVDLGQFRRIRPPGRADRRVGGVDFQYRWGLIPIGHIAQTDEPRPGGQVATQTSFEVVCAFFRRAKETYRWFWVKAVMRPLSDVRSLTIGPARC